MQAVGVEPGQGIDWPVRRAVGSCRLRATWSAVAIAPHHLHQTDSLKEPQEHQLHNSDVVQTFHQKAGYKSRSNCLYLCLSNLVNPFFLNFGAGTKA